MGKKPGPKETKFVPDKVEKILERIKNNVPYDIAAKSVGVSPSYLFRWIEIGEKDLEDKKHTEHAKFVESLNTIKANRIEEHTSKIAALKKSHKGSEWILNFVYSKYFSNNAQTREIAQKIEELELMLKQRDKENS